MSYFSRYSITQKLAKAHTNVTSVRCHSLNWKLIGGSRSGLYGTPLDFLMFTPSPLAPTFRLLCQKPCNRVPAPPGKVIVEVEACGKPRFFGTITYSLIELTTLLNIASRHESEVIQCRDEIRPQAIDHKPRLPQPNIHELASPSLFFRLVGDLCHKA